MAKKKQSPNPFTCGHDAAVCIIIDNLGHCSTCAAERIAKMAQVINPRAMQHYVPLTEENHESVMNRLHALHAEMRQEALEKVQARTGTNVIERTGAGNAAHPEYAAVNRLGQAIIALERYWRWFTTSEGKAA